MVAGAWLRGRDHPQPLPGVHTVETLVWSAPSHPTPTATTTATASRPELSPQCSQWYSEPQGKTPPLSLLPPPYLLPLLQTIFLTSSLTSHPPAQ